MQDAEGWSSDVTLLRKQLLAVDRKLHQMRLMDRLQVMLSDCWCRQATWAAKLQVPVGSILLQQAGC